MGARNTIHLSKLKTDCRWGDLILFKCANSMSRLQRSVTGSEWDHVGIVVSSPLLLSCAHCTDVL